MPEKRIIRYDEAWQFDGKVEFNDTVTLTGESITGGTFSGATLTAPTISGAATMASGATLTTPTLLMTAASVTATGATGSTAAALSAVTPAWYAVTGASASGVGLPTGPAGSVYAFKNMTTGDVLIYCVGGTINGTTGTTAYTLTTTGNDMCFAFCTSATGAWIVGGNT